MELEQLDMHMQKKKKSRHRPYTLQNNELNMNHRTKSKTQNHKFQSVT